MAADLTLQHVAVAVEVDPVETFFLGRPLPPAHAPDDRHDRSVSGLRSLARDYAWGGVLELATSLLADDDDAVEHVNASAALSLAALAAPEAGPPAKPLLLPHERLLCEAHRALALVQTRMFDRATAAMEELGSVGPGNPKYRYESYPESYPGHAPGSFVPFELLALAIEVRVRTGDASAIADCYGMRERFPEHSLFLTSSLVGYHLRAQQHDTAVDLAHDLVLRQGSSARALYLYGRILLHVGDVGEARRAFSLADASPDASDELRHVHRGLALASQGEYVRALAENDLVVRAEADSQGDSRHVRMFAHCNAAICLMQLGRLSDAIARLESCLRSDPETSLDEGLVFNLCTMYDLAFPDEAAEKKQTLRRLASRYGRQGFNLDM
jgi:trafficking protein particle complex subunit 12